MLFTIEVLDRLIVEQAVRVDATRDLVAWISQCINVSTCGLTRSRSFMARRSRVRHRVRRTLAATERV